jgi:hypothetical protein
MNLRFFNGKAQNTRSYLHFILVKKLKALELDSSNSINPSPLGLYIKSKFILTKLYNNMGNCGCKDGTGDRGQIYVQGKQTPDDANLEELDKAAVKIQARFKGHQVRKGLKDTEDPHYNPEGHPPSANFGTLLSQVPNYYNNVTQEVVHRIGPYRFANDDPADANLPHLGPYELENSAVYIGQWRNGLRHGRGKQIWNDGSVYEGYWKNNMASGKGRLIHADGDVFEGDWSNDKAHGKGKYTHLDGAIYEGDWIADKQNGQGVETWTDGARYEGQYRDGKKEGFGRFTWADGSRYEGEFRNNNIEGRGIYNWADGRRFEGDWRLNKMEGRGVFTWADGKRYEGQYLDDKKHGYGIFNWPDNKRYEGNWAYGKQHGKGSFYGSGGQRREGEWNDGKRVRWTDDFPAGKTSDFEAHVH